MNKLFILTWLLAGALTLSACGGGNPAANRDASSSGTDASQTPAQSEPAPAASAPEVTHPDVPEPDASQPDASQPDASVQGDAGQPQPDTVQTQEPAPAAVTKPSKEPAPAAVTKPPKDVPAQEPEPPAPEADPQPEPEPEPKAAPTKEDAQACIGKSVSSLYSAIGKPSGSDYAPSCLGDGEDGELFYDGFTVYTYRLDGKETVQDVE